MGVAFLDPEKWWLSLHFLPKPTREVKPQQKDTHETLNSVPQWFKQLLHGLLPVMEVDTVSEEWSPFKFGGSLFV